MKYFLAPMMAAGLFVASTTGMALAGNVHAVTGTTGQPNQTIGTDQTGSVTPGHASTAPGSAFNPDGVADSKYAGTQPQNSNNPKSVSQYDVAGFQDWYDKLGFDPLSMGEREMRELQKAAEERWKASIPGTQLQKRERLALEQLAVHGPNVPVPWREIKNCGPGTQDRLKARGNRASISAYEAAPSNSGGNVRAGFCCGVANITVALAGLPPPKPQAGHLPDTFQGCEANRVLVDSCLIA